MKIKRMMLKIPNLSIFRNFAFLMIGLFLCHHGLAQSLFVGSGAEFYLAKDMAFTTSNSIVDVDAFGIFSVEAGSNWGSSQEYVNGAVTAYGTGETLLPTGDNGVYAPVKMDHTGVATANYVNSPPSIGSNGTNVDDVADVEYWEMTGTAIVKLPWNENSDITSLVNDNGGALSSVAIAGVNGGVWDLISASQSNTVSGDLLNGDVTSDINIPANLNGFSQFTFGIDHQILLDVNDLFLTTGINLVSNPVNAGQDNIEFTTSEEMVDLKVSIYDINGRLMKTFDKVDVYLGVGNLPKSNLKSGLYFVKFEHEGKQGVKKVIIE